MDRINGLMSDSDYNWLWNGCNTEFDGQFISNAPMSTTSIFKEHQEFLLKFKSLTNYYPYVFDIFPVALLINLLQKMSNIYRKYNFIRIKIRDLRTFILFSLEKYMKIIIQIRWTIHIFKFTRRIFKFHFIHHSWINLDLL